MNLTELWEEGPVRFFLSYQSEYKAGAAQLKTALNLYGIACFVAHEDIEPLRKWRDEIKDALFSMDVLVALLTSRFNDSDWTNQEVGVAVGREIPIIPVHLGKDPHGFVGDLQAVPTTNKTIEQIAESIFLNARKVPQLTSRMDDAYILGIQTATNFRQAKQIARILNQINGLNDSQVERLVGAYNSNDQVYQCYDFRDLIVPYLNQMTTGFARRRRDGSIAYTPAYVPSPF